MKDFLLRLAESNGLKLKEKELQSILRYASSEPKNPERGKRLQQIAQQVGAGTYQIDYERCVDGILGESSEAITLLSLMQAVKIIPPGQEHWRLFEKTCSMLIPLLFTPELGQFESQHRIGRRSICDLSAYNQASTGFWYDMKICHCISHVIFEIKNKDRLEGSEIDQIIRYASPFRAVVALTRETHPQAVYEEMANVLSKGKVVLPISTKDLEAASGLLANGQLGSEALIPHYKQLAAALP